jgi:hypothetical protein
LVGITIIQTTILLFAFYKINTLAMICPESARKAVIASVLEIERFESKILENEFMLDHFRRLSIVEEKFKGGLNSQIRDGNKIYNLRKDSC